MAYDLVTMQLEVLDRGFPALAGSPRLTRYINNAMHEIDDQMDWPYLRTVTTGASPLAITDFRRVLSVVDVGNLNPLSYMDERTVTDYYADTAGTGTALYYYVTGGTTINAFPVSTATLTVRYLKVAPDLAAATDTPLMPDRYREAIVHYAVAACLMDESNFDESTAVRQAGDVYVARMRDALFTQAGESEAQVITNASSDW